ncbi:hypothetical protein Tco_0607439, partial [Tanacetum coccineum]
MVLNNGKGWEANAAAAAAEVSRQPTRTRDNRADRLRTGAQPSPLYVQPGSRGAVADLQKSAQVPRGLCSTQR